MSSKFGECVLHLIKRNPLTNCGGAKSNKFQTCKTYKKNVNYQFGHLDLDISLQQSTSKFLAKTKLNKHEVEKKTL